jgi:hypothetical protein
MGLAAKVTRMVIDHAVAAMAIGVTGANKTDYHMRNVVPGRDFPLAGPNVVVADIRNAVPGDTHAGQPLEFARGIEVGHVFKLGSKYSEALSAKFLDENGVSHPCLMGCYGIGINRILASAIELFADANGICLPAAIAPFDVEVLPLNRDKQAVVDEAEPFMAVPRRPVLVCREACNGLVLWKKPLPSLYLKFPNQQYNRVAFKRRTLVAEGDRIYVVLTPDGRRAISSGADGTTRLWDLATGAELRRLTRGARWSRPAVTPDGQRFFLAESATNSLGLRELESERLVRSFALPEPAGLRGGLSNRYSRIAFSADGRRALIGGWWEDAGHERRGELFLWRLPDRLGYWLLGTREEK